MVHGSFLKVKLVDHIQLFYAPFVAGDDGTGVIKGIKANGGRNDAIRLQNITQRRLGDDVMISGDVLYPDYGE